MIEVENTSESRERIIHKYDIKNHDDIVEMRLRCEINRIRNNHKEVLFS